MKTLFEATAEVLADIASLFNKASGIPPIIITRPPMPQAIVCNGCGFSHNENVCPACGRYRS